MRFPWAIAVLAGVVLASPVLAADVTLPRAPVRVVTAAPAPLSGDVSFYGGALISDSETFGLFGGEGRIAWGMGNSMVLQADVGGQTTVFNGGFGVTQFGLTAHVYDRGANGALGIKAGVGNSTPLISTMLGAEGQIYLNNVTLGAEVNDTWYTLCDCSVFQARGLARLYVSPNTRFQLDASWWSGEFVGNTLWAVGGSLSHRFMGTPIDINAGVRYDSNDFVNAVTAKAGFTFNFDGPGSTKLSHDRNNVVFDKFDLIGLGGAG